MRATLRLLLAATILAPFAGEAAAQGMIRPAARPNAGPTAGAPALPGLAARPAPPPIAGDATANLSPNAALFDAIGRGDLPAARDAVSRGANLDSRNALGLTALDAAVDQGRNEIVFYLLSARDMSRGAPVERGEASLGAPPRAAARVPARREAALPASAPSAAQPAVPRAARLWAGDGGSPQPEIGFLGFDAGRPAGRAPAAARRDDRG